MSRQFLSPLKKSNVLYFDTCCLALHARIYLLAANPDLSYFGHLIARSGRRFAVPVRLKTLAIDAGEASFPPSQNSHYSQSRHFYLAVDRLQFKMETLKDLLGLVGRRPCLPIVVCCSTRDELDFVCSTFSSLPFISLSVLYSDLAESERAHILEKFQQVTTRWGQVNHVGTENEDEDGKDEERSHMIVVTDACLPLLASGESPLSGHLLINYELPAKKETYMRRIATCLAADGFVINMVVGGEVVSLKGIEESSGIVIQEMPMQILDIL